MYQMKYQTFDGLPFNFFCRITSGKIMQILGHYADRGMLVSELLDTMLNANHLFISVQNCL